MRAVVYLNLASDKIMIIRLIIISLLISSCGTLKKSRQESPEPDGDQILKNIREGKPINRISISENYRPK